jgi:ribosomal protein L37AE/L43A
MSRVNAIPTVYNGIEFRSRLEAKWAIVFNELGWTWEYEPIDLDGYIPDFILTFPYAPILVEVKPATTREQLEDATTKIENSGWTEEALIVGATTNFDEACGFSMFGLVSQNHTYPEGVDTTWWDYATFHRCSACKRQSFHHMSGAWFCHVCGKGDGDHYLEPSDALNNAWKIATNTIKYRHGKR